MTDDKALKTLVRLISDEIEKKGVSERELARRAGISSATVNKALRAESMTLSTLLGIAKGLGVSPAYLLASPAEREHLKGPKAGRPPSDVSVQEKLQSLIPLLPDSFATVLYDMAQVHLMKAKAPSKTGSRE